MKINYIKLVILAITFLTLLSSCRNANIDKKILEDADNFNNVFEINRDYSLEEYYGDYERETLSVPTDIDDFYDIYSPMYNFFNNDRYYFTVKKRYETAHELDGREIYVYVDLKTGEKHYICSDPLCTHIEMGECKYLNMNSAMFFIDKNIFYITSIEGFYDESNIAKKFSIYKINLNTNKIENVYQCVDDFTKVYITISFIYNNRLYFLETERISLTKDDSKKEYREVSTLKTLNLETQKIENERLLPQNYTLDTGIIYIDNYTCFFNSIKRLFFTDLSFLNEEIIYDFQNNEYLGDYFYDKNTKELYFNVRNDKLNTGDVYVYKNGKLERVNLSNENNIYCFQLTDSKIYYSIYEPFYYGISPRGGEVYDYISGKVYESDRKSISESKLIFDGSGEFNLHKYVIVGDYLYFDYMDFMNDGTFVWFSKALELKKARINFKNNTIKYISFD